MFQDFKVLELASVLAGPSVGQFFAELGAEVIKVENKLAGGDVTRTWKGANEKTDDRSAYFCSVNWGKKSIAVDLTSTEGRSIVQQLTSRCDVVIASYKPGDAERLGVAYSQLATVNPQLIYGQITGYGSDSDRVGYDAVIQAESGFMDLNGEPEGPPTKMPVALIDVLAAHQLKEGLLVALLKREKTGKGSLVEVSLIQSAVASLVNQASNWLVANQLPKRQGSAHPNIAPYGELFMTQDDKQILIAIGTDRQFTDLLKTVNLEQYRTDLRFNNNANRVKHRTLLHEILSSAIRSFDSQEFLKLVNQRKIPAGLIQNISDVFTMPQAHALLIKSHELSGVRSFVASGLDLANHQLLPPPHFGEHTEQILKWLRG